MKKLTGIYFRWLSELQSFEFEIKHRPGKKNLNADALSRSKHLREQTKEEEEEQAEYIHNLHELGRKVDQRKYNESTESRCSVKTSQEVDKER